jgi:hypothetical protein
MGRSPAVSFLVENSADVSDALQTAFAPSIFFNSYAAQCQFGQGDNASYTYEGAIKGESSSMIWLIPGLAI